MLGLCYVCVLGLCVCARVMLGLCVYARVMCVC